MSEQQRALVAKEYVNQQLDTMRQNGMLSADISQEEYQGLVDDITEAIDPKIASRNSSATLQSEVQRSSVPASLKAHS